MEVQLKIRLDNLKAEFESGQKMLADLENKQVKLRESLLRISGAIQVLEEALSKPSPAPDNVEALDVANKASS